MQIVGAHEIVRDKSLLFDQRQYDVHDLTIVASGRADLDALVAQDFKRLQETRDELRMIYHSCGVHRGKHSIELVRIRGRKGSIEFIFPLLKSMREISKCIDVLPFG